MGFPRQGYWISLPFLSPGNLPDAGIEPVSPAWQVDSLPLATWEAQNPLLSLFILMLIVMGATLIVYTFF